MKRQISFLFLIIIHCITWSKKGITTGGPCSDATAQHANGRWMKHASFDSGNEGLLDSSAIVLVQYYSSSVFETDPLKGHMLVTENPDIYVKTFQSMCRRFL